MIEKIKQYNLLFVVTILMILIVVLFYIVKNYTIINSLSNSIYVIIGSLISGIVTIIWNESLFRRTRNLEKENEIQEIQKTYDEIISLLSSIKVSIIENIGLLEKNKEIFELHLLSTGFWELSISKIPLKDQTEEAFRLLQNIDIGTKYNNRLILDRQELMVNQDTNVKLRIMNETLMENFQILLHNINEYTKPFIEDEK
jgi:hypothetical protein